MAQRNNLLVHSWPRPCNDVDALAASLLICKINAVAHLRDPPYSPIEPAIQMINPIESLVH